jgi:hypothetical protein
VFVCCVGVLMVGINSKHNHKIAKMNEVNFNVSNDIKVSKSMISGRVGYGTSSYGCSRTRDAVFQRTLDY